MSDAIERLADVIALAMEAAGMDRDDDPLLLPEKIEELRFAAGVLFDRGEYPRHDTPRKETKPLAAGPGGRGVAQLARALKSVAR